MISSFEKYTAFTIVYQVNTLLSENKVLRNVNIIKQKISFTTYLSVESYHV